MGPLASDIAQSIAQDIAAPIEGFPAYQELLYLFDANEQGLLFPSVNQAIADQRLYQDAAGTTLASAVNDPVGKVEDYSGNGNHLTQTTAPARPLLKQDGNGNWYLQFDGVDDFLVTSSIDFTGTAQMAAFVAAMIENPSSNAGILGLTDSLGAAGSFLLRKLSTNTTLQSVLTGSLTGGVQGTVPSSPFVATGVYDISAIAGAENGLRINGGSTLWATQDSGAGNFTNAPIYIGKTGSAFHQGRVYSALVVGRTATSAEVDFSESYFASQSGVTL